MDLVLLALGLGCVWHGAQIIWVAPTPRLLQRDLDKQNRQDKEVDPARAFQIFWLDQYAWLGIALTVLGVIFCLAAAL